MAEPHTSPVALRQSRERTIAALCEHFALDHLETEELERRLDAAHQATSLAQMDALLQDLPDLATPAAPVPQRADDAPRPAPLQPREQQMVVAIMGGTERKGSWTPARQVNVVALMGGALLDFRQAQLAPGVTEVNVLAIMGGVEILVPPGVVVDSNGIGIMGGFEHVGEGRFPVDSSVPVLRITGLAVMGGVEIQERLPGERGSDAKKRRREEQRRLRAQYRRERELE